MLAIILIAGITTYLIKKKVDNIKSIIDVLPEHTAYVQMLSGYVKCMELAEMSNISIDETTKKDIYDFAYSLNEVFEEIGYGDVSTTELTHLAYIYSYYKFDCGALKEELEGHYIPEEKLFNSYWYTGEDSKTPGYVFASIELLLNLNTTGKNVLADFELDNGLIEWFNQNLPNISENEEDMSDYYTILTLFYNTDIAGELKCEPLKNRTLTYLKEISEAMDTYKPTVFDVAYLEEGVIYSSYYTEYNEIFSDKAVALYNDISSFEGFGYDISDKYSVLIMSYCLRDHYTVCETIYNDFLNVNLNEMLYNHFEKYCKGKIGK